MRIDTLSATNFLKFKSSKFEFDPYLNLIVGANASGKSSLLLALQAVLSDGVHMIADRTVETLPVSDAHFEMSVTKGQVRFERVFPVTVRATGTIFGKHVEWAVVRSSSVGNSESTFGLYRVLKEKMAGVDSSAPFTIPLVAFYSAHRTLRTDAPQLDAALRRVSRMDGNKHWSNALVDLGDFQKWIIGKTLERLQAISEGFEPNEQEDELRIVNQAISGCIPGLEEVKFDIRLRQLTIFFSDGQSLPFSSLSDGQQSVVALLADVARRMCILNPFLGVDVLTETDGLLVIDELDTHLHPGWQRRILKQLREKFPKLQLFATCHSPSMIGGLHPSQVIIMREGQQTRAETTFGLTVDQVLAEILEIEYREPQVDKQLHDILESVARGDLSSAQAELAEMKELAPSLPDYGRIEALMRRKGVIGR